MKRRGHPIAVGSEVGEESGEVFSPAKAREAVRAAVASWESVTTADHRFGGLEFRVGRRELGHIHGTFADLPFPRKVRDVLIAEGRARPHHVLPQSGWVTVPMRTASEIANVIELFRQNYDRG
jgi:hypothetical protein